MFKIFTVFFSLFNCFVFNQQITHDLRTKCELILENSIREEIRQKSQVVDAIVETVVNGKESRETYDQLAKFVDKFGPRFTGTATLEKSIDYLVDLLKREGLDVKTEEVVIPKWERGNEWANILTPRKQKIGMLGIGLSVGTSGVPISAAVLVVKSFDELEKRKEEVKGKIVLYDFKFKSYGESVKYRTSGASKASKYGAVAVLVRSVTPFSLYTPHTGMLSYEENVTRIPAACVTIEDAELIHRMSLRANVTVELFMEAKTLNETGVSRNVVIDIRGSKYPKEFVIVSGHIDSWDVGQGAMDDGGGAFVSWRALVVANRLGLRPKRTLRAILWTAEEVGLVGAQSYVDKHAKEMENVSIAMESDIGTFTPFGLVFSGKNAKSKCVVYETLQLLKSINTTNVLFGVEGSDTVLFTNYNVPIASLYNDEKTYFYFHHTNADTMTVEDPKQLDLCTAMWTASSFVFADLENKLWR